MGFAMSSKDFACLHYLYNVYEGLEKDEKSQKTTYIMQFLWRILTSDFDITSHAHPQSKHVSSTPLLPVLCWHILEVSQHLFPLLPRKWGLGWGWSLSSSCHPSSSCCRYTCADKCKHVHVGTRAKNSNGTIMRTFSNFNILCGHCMLLPFPSFLPLLCHYALLFKF